ncbi:MAG: tRNA (guanosine(37)-N1)-methyltransferase TrmD [Candidatus Nomurabacteria bacterium]|jgi:tRNA (guanine37-N1)-methyltransferase|nr:tRNA (guanosine(37)-N1)-methyltransferase TrmD [Candidatus Nomurabacteria bacterium]
MKFAIITLFPEMFDKVLNSSMLWKAQEKQLVSFELINLRDFGLGARRRVDDTPYGGGDGMLLMVEPLLKAVEHAKTLTKSPKIWLMSPSRHIWSQQDASEAASSGGDRIIICGHYEGVDARILQFVDDVISVGNYVLTGGELPAMTVIDSIVRLIPGVLGGAQSATIESFSSGNNLEFPQYTRPEVFRDLPVPKVLLSGNHATIAQWREQHGGNVVT